MANVGHKIFTTIVMINETVVKTSNVIGGETVTTTSTIKDENSDMSGSIPIPIENRQGRYI